MPSYYALSEGRSTARCVCGRPTKISEVFVSHGVDDRLLTLGVDEGLATRGVDVDGEVLRHVFEGDLWQVCRGRRRGGREGLGLWDGAWWSL